MFNDEKIKLIRTMPEGDKVIVTWVQLLCLAGKTNDGGGIYMGQNIYYTDEMLATLCDQPVNIMRIALKTLQQFGMIEWLDNGLIQITNWEKHQSTDKMARMKEQTRLRQQRHYYRNKLRELGFDVDAEGFTSDLDELKAMLDESEEPNVRLTLANDTEVRSKKKEVRSKKKENNSHNSAKAKYDDDSIYLKMAKEFFMEIRKNNDEAKQPNFQTWADDMRKIVELDGRSVSNVRDLYKWTQRDDFWKGNILSPKKLRDKYDQLKVQSGRANATNGFVNNKKTSDGSIPYLDEKGVFE